MKRTVSLIIFIALFNMFCLTAHAEPVGKFTKVEGRVDITSPGASARQVNTEDEISVGDIVRVKSKSKAEIVFVDGGILRIAQKSRVKINEYIVGKEQRKGVFNLFRGKIENVVKKSGGIFGFKKKNKQEVHTPTAVCGVRGTNFFSIHQRGISNFIFKDGQGYGYSKNQPDKVMNINAGQAMVVISPSVPPIIRNASVNEITRHSSDTAVKEKEEENKDQEKKDDKQIDKKPGDNKRDDEVKDKKSGDDKSRNQKPGDKKMGDDNRSGRKRDRYTQTGDKTGDDGRDDNGTRHDSSGDRRPSDQKDDRRGNNGPGDYGPGDGRRGDYGPGNYGPKDGRPGDAPGDYGPKDGRSEGSPPPGGYESGTPPPSRGDYRAEGPMPPGGKFYLAEGPPPGEYWGEGPPPPGSDYNPDGPPTPGDYGQWGSLPSGKYRGEGPLPPGDYGVWGPSQPGDDYFWGGPGDFYMDDFKPDDYWGEPGDDYFWGEPIDDYWGPDIAYNIDDYIPGFRVDNISISGNSGTNKYDLVMSGIYNWNPPFIYMYEDIKGQMSGDLKQGYFLGFTGCSWNKFEQRVDGIASFFYIDSGDETGGLFMGDVTGSYSIDPNDWSATGSLDFVELGTGLSVPGSVADIIDYARDTFFVSGGGDFFDAGSVDVGNFNITQARGIFDSIQETQYWGYWRTKIEGSYSTIDGKSMNDFDHWFTEWEQRGLVTDLPDHPENLRLYMSAVGGDSYYTYGEFEGDTAGGWVDIEHAVTGIAVGEIHGGYDPSGVSTDIFAASGGVWLETGQLLNMVSTRPNDLAKLGIPNIEIGKATIAGSYNDGGGNGIAVTMTDVTFLAHQSGGTPRIWVTDSVAGTYTGTPLTDWTVGLSQSGGGTNASGLTADFKLRTWDTNSNKWAATVNGSGQVGSPLKDITFKGGAGGNIDSPAAGQLSGTAAGWSK